MDTTEILAHLKPNLLSWLEKATYGLLPDVLEAMQMHAEEEVEAMTERVFRHVFQTMPEPLGFGSHPS